jgi:hypothetical protein
MLDGCDDAFLLRAAELFFRPQKLSRRDEALIAVDEEAAWKLKGESSSPLASLLGLPAAGGIEVLGDVNAEDYWERSDLFDMALDLTAGGRGLVALGDVVRRWISHLLAIDVEIEPVIEVRNAPWAWYVGLDAEATRIGDALWKGEYPGDPAGAGLVGLYRLSFVDPNNVIDEIRGEPIYLLMAATPDDGLRLKPQNLVAGLPIRQRETTG